MVTTKVILQISTSMSLLLETDFGDEISITVGVSDIDDIPDFGCYFRSETAREKLVGEESSSASSDPKTDFLVDLFATQYQSETSVTALLLEKPRIFEHIEQAKPHHRFLNPEIRSARGAARMKTSGKSNRSKC